MAQLEEVKHLKLGDIAGHPFQSNPQLDESKVTKADNVESPVSVTVNAKKDHASPPMKAVVWNNKRDIRVEDRPRPVVTDPEDVVVKITSTCICGSDLHLYEGYMVGMQKGDIVGHEPMGIVDQVGPGVKKLKKGDRVVVCFDLGCSRCSYCSHGMYSSCATTNPSEDQEALYGHKTGGFLGYSHMLNGYEGGQAEYLRVPFADTNCLKIDAAETEVPDNKVVLLSDILPTAWHANEMGEVGPGRTVAIWGAGPVGILAAHCAFYRGAARVVIIDSLKDRLVKAQQVVKGVEIIDYSETKVDEALRKMFPEFQGPDTCIEAVGFHYAKTLLHNIEQKVGLETDPSDVVNALIRCCRKGGCVSIVGAYAGYTNHFNLGAFMEKGLTMRGGQTPVQRYWPTLVDKVLKGELDPTIVITHEMPLEDAAQAYHIFNSKLDNCVKVVLKPSLRKDMSPAAPGECL